MVSPPLRLGRRSLSGGFGHRLGHAREIEFESGSLPRFAVDPDISAGLFDHAVNRGQPQSGALAFFLGGEEGLENAAAGFGVHAVAGVAHRDHGELARLHAHVGSGVVFVEHHVGGFDCQAPAQSAWHRAR